MPYNSIKIKPYTLKELAGLYGVCYKTLAYWLEPFHNDVGKRRGRFFTIVQVETIFLKLGKPNTD